jgi:hypothetical protein
LILTKSNAFSKTKMMNMINSKIVTINIPVNKKNEQLAIKYAIIIVYLSNGQYALEFVAIIYCFWPTAFCEKLNCSKFDFKKIANQF